MLHPFAPPAYCVLPICSTNPFIRDFTKHEHPFMIRPAVYICTLHSWFFTRDEAEHLWLLTLHVMGGLAASAFPRVAKGAAESLERLVLQVKFWGITV